MAESGIPFSEKHFKPSLNNDEVVKSRSHTKTTEDTKKNLNVFNRPLFVPLCLRGEKLTFYESINNNRNI
jgi:hypothetical protein